MDLRGPPCPGVLPERDLAGVGADVLPGDQPGGLLVQPTLSVRLPVVVVSAVAELVVQVLHSLVEDGPELRRRERELYEIIQAYVASDAGTLQGILGTLPGTLGHVSYGG